MREKHRKVRDRLLKLNQTVCSLHALQCGKYLQRGASNLDPWKFENSASVNSAIWPMFSGARTQATYVIEKDYFSTLVQFRGATLCSHSAHSDNYQNWPKVCEALGIDVLRIHLARK
jgi:hypothetical protein